MFQAFEGQAHIFLVIAVGLAVLVVMCFQETAKIHRRILLFMLGIMYEKQGCLQYLTQGREGHKKKNEPYECKTTFHTDANIKLFRLRKC